MLSYPIEVTAVTREALDIVFFTGFMIAGLSAHRDLAAVLMIGFALLFLKNWNGRQ